MDLKDMYGKTALHYSALAGHLEIVKLLVKYKAGKEEVDSGQRTALHLAAISGQSGVVTYLLSSGSMVGGRDIFGENCLDGAISKNQALCIRAILSSDEWKESLRNVIIKDVMNIIYFFIIIVEAYNLYKCTVV